MTASQTMPPLVIRSARPSTIGSLLSPVAMVQHLWGYRDLIRQFSIRYFLQRYRGTYLGVLWALFVPLMMLGVYTFVFNYVFAARWGVHTEESRSQYAVILFCGISAYGIFSECVMRSSALILDNPSYVTKVVFPVEVLPIASLFSALMFACFSIGLVLAGTLLFFGTLPWTVILLPVVLLPLLLLALGVSWFVSSLAVFVRDVGNLVSIVVSQLLFFLTPVFYRVEQIPEELRRWAYLNPLTPVVEGVRRVVIFGDQPDWQALAIVTAISLLVLQLGYAWFMKSKRGFADVI